MRVDFEKLKLIPLRAILAHYGIEMREAGDFLIGNCPLPSHKTGKPDTFKASISGNWWTCFSQSCRAKLGKSGGDVVDLVCQLDGVKPLDAGRKLTKLFQNQNAPREAERNGGTTPTGMGEPVKNKPLSFTLQANPEHPLIQSHGISVETAADWKIGYYENKQGTASMHQRIIFPLIEDDSLVGYIGRATLEGQEPKWKMGVRHRTMLFGLERCDLAKVLIVCESPWSVLWFFQGGHQCAALLGTSMTEEQERRLELYGTIILGMDNDEAGKEASQKLAERLMKHHKVIRSFLKE
jgi:hypothetical protein